MCVKNLEAIDSLLSKEDKKKEDKIVEAIGKHCTSSG